MPPQHPIEIAKELLQGVSAEQFRGFGIEALRRWRKHANSSSFQIHGDFGLEIVPLLAQAKNRTGVDPNAVKEPFLSEQGHPWMLPVIDFTAWLVAAGLAVPLQFNTSSGYPVAYGLTTAGFRLFGGFEDHPSLPGFVDRVVARCPGLPDEVPVHLVDARACLDYGLGRPAVSLTGLAYEAAENEAIVFLEENRGLVLKKDARAAQRIAAVLKIIPQLFEGDLDRQGRARAAWDFADQLRDRRNHAAHPRAYADFSDLTEVHEFIVSVARHLPGLWSVRV